MSPRQRVMAFAKDNNCDVFNSSGGKALDVTLWAPVGLAFVASGCHALVISYFTDAPAGWRALWEDVSKGLEPCDQSDCETCEAAA